MQAAIEASTEAWTCELKGQSSERGTWLAQTIYRNPSNRARVLAIDPQLFAETISSLGKIFLIDELACGTDRRGYTLDFFSRYDCAG